TARRSALPTSPRSLETVHGEAPSRLRWVGARTLTPHLPRLAPIASGLRHRSISTEVQRAFRGGPLDAPGRSPLDFSVATSSGKVSAGARAPHGRGTTSQDEEGTR